MVLALLSMVVLTAPQAVAHQEANPAAVPRTAPVTATLAAKAELLRAQDPKEWARLEGEVAGILAEHARLSAGWKDHSPPPPPDLAAAGMPAPFLMDGFLEVRGDRSRTSLAQVWATALTKSDDPRALEALMEAHDEAPQQPYGLARVMARSAPRERISAMILAQVRREPEVRDGVLALELLERVRHGSRRGVMDLPAEVGAAARAWLSTYGRGPANGAGEAVWRARLRLGGAADREALIPYLLDDADLLYDLWVILDAPVPHAELAGALRTRRDRMTEHERSFLGPIMHRALLVSDPDGELDGYLASLERLLATPDPNGRTPDLRTDEAMQRFQVDSLVLVDVAHPKAHAARSRYVRDGRIPWHSRGHLVAEAWSAGRDDREGLRDWFLENAPPPQVAELRRRIASLSASSAAR